MTQKKKMYTMRTKPFGEQVFHHKTTFDWPVLESNITDQIVLGLALGAL